MTPLAAAAAVIAVIAASLALTSSNGSRTAPSGHPGGGPAVAGLPADVLASIPAYYVGLTGYRARST